MVGNRRDRDSGRGWLRAKLRRSGRMLAVYGLLAIFVLLSLSGSTRAIDRVSAASPDKALTGTATGLGDANRSPNSNRGGSRQDATPTSVPPTPTTEATATTVPPTATVTGAGPNLALQRPATASSLESASYTAGFAVDGDTSLRWSSQFSDPQWLSVDLGRTYAVNRVRLNWEGAYGKAYQIQLSDDAINWRTVYSTATGGGGVEDLVVNNSGRYVRVYGTQRGTEWGYSLWEMEAYGTASVAPTNTPVATATTAPVVVPTNTPRPATSPTASSVPATPTATATPPPAPTATPTSSGNPGPLGDSSPWNLAFRDEFDGGLNTSKWTTCYPWFNAQTGCTNAGNNELQWYLPDGVSVGNGVAKLTAQKRTVTGTNGKTYNYTSGMISSGPSKFSYQYGFIEARVKLPAGKGMWPAFWTLPADQSWPPEVDVLENWGNPNQVTFNVHWNGGSGHQQDLTNFTGPDFTAGFHTIGLSWSPTSLVWYVDGVARKTFTNTAGIPAKPMYILLNLAIDGNNPPDGSTPFPAAMEIDYVRGWTK